MLPWDDDVDLRASILDRHKVNEIIVKELAQEPYSVIVARAPGIHNYDKVYFSWCPRAGRKFWNYPFVDIFYDDKNSTHIWQADVGENRAGRPPVVLDDVFPLVLRPFGPLWLYAPREPLAHLDSQGMRQVETKCIVFSYNHKHEIFQAGQSRALNCSQINSIYPFVDRRCTSQNCSEYLKLGNHTIIHKITYPFVYKTCQDGTYNVSFKSC